MAAGLHPNLISPDEAYVVVPVEESYPIKGDADNMSFVRIVKDFNNKNIDLSGFNPGLKMRVYSATIRVMYHRH